MYMFERLRAWKARRNALSRAENVREARAKMYLRSKNLGASLYLRTKFNSPNNNRAINAAQRAINNARRLNAKARVSAKNQIYRNLYFHKLSNNAILVLAGYSPHRLAVGLLAQNRR
jgi:hypothetical protein